MNRAKLISLFVSEFAVTPEYAERLVDVGERAKDYDMNERIRTMRKRRFQRPRLPR